MGRRSLTDILQQRLVLLILAPGILCLVLVGVLTATRERTLLEERNKLLVESLDSYVESYLLNAVRGLRFLALNSDLTDTAEIERDGGMLFRIFSFYEKIVVVDQGNTVLLSIPEGMTGIDYPRPRPRTMASDGTFDILSTPYISPESGRLVVFVEAFSPDGITVAGELDLFTLQQFLTGFLDEEAGDIILADRFGNVIVHPDQRLVRQQMNIGGEELFQQALTSRESVFFHSRGEDRFYASATRVDPSDWVLIISKPASSIYLPILQGLGFICLMAVPPALIFFWLLRRDMLNRFARPLRAFARSIRHVGRGEYTGHGHQEGAFLELDEMAEEFAGMAEKLREREEALKRSEARYRTIFDNAAEGIFQSLPEGRFRDANPALAAMLGFESREQLLEEVTDLGRQLYVDTGDRDRLMALIRRDGRVFEELRVRRRDGSVIWVLMMARSVHDDDGNLRYVEGFVQDITERKQSWEMMVQTEKMMTVGGLASGMAHELNNPLAGIIQGLQNVRRRLDPSRPLTRRKLEEAGLSADAFATFLDGQSVGAQLDDVRQEGIRAARIIQDMLSFSRKSDSRLLEVDMNRLLDETIDLAGKDYNLKKQYDFRKIAIVRNYDPGLGEVVCSGPEIQQVVLNLLKNAAQAVAAPGNGAGDPEIRISTYREESRVVIEVEDNGPGMDEETRSKIFEPFFTTKEPGEGTGLGLFVSYYIVTQKHGGTFLVNSRPGQGARFTVSLPIGESTACRLPTRH